ncbi:MAG: hypothetical protein LBH28_10890 [Oscillospiraceae bacterium]|jgi:hypothetical protein|nr:hypothetical protein [Oscillospiraceae bacterium]
MVRGDCKMKPMKMKDAFIENVEIKAQQGKTLISDEIPVSHASITNDNE